jgi:NADH:ubiquinone oxidoreductase subunit F (NADH-binding)
MTTTGEDVCCAVRDPQARETPGLPRLLPRILDGQPPSLARHLARHGELRTGDAGLVAEIEQSGLTGRGGAAFPTARKLAAVASAPGSPVVVVNGTEGEPASAKDKVLMATEPHLVLDGAVVAARITGAREVYFVAHPPVAAVVADAIRARRALGLDDVGIRVVPAADGFVAGEASAVVNWLAGGPPVPTPVPPRLAQHGLHGQPTLVQNAETLAHLALIARYGARWFRELGTAAEPGSMLVTVIGAVRHPGVREIEIGTPVTDVLAAAGGLDRPLRALLIGGYFGTWVPWPDAASLPFSAAGLADLGAAPAAGLVAALPADACGLAEIARVARYLADESAGQCGPCVFGLDAIASELSRVAAGQSASMTLLRRWLSQVDGRGACRHPDGAVRFIRSGLEVFGPELDLHAAGWCSGTDLDRVLPVLLPSVS